MPQCVVTAQSGYIQRQCTQSYHTDSQLGIYTDPQYETYRLMMTNETVWHNSKKQGKNKKCVVEIACSFGTAVKSFTVKYSMFMWRWAVPITDILHIFKYLLASFRKRRAGLSATAGLFCYVSTCCPESILIMWDRSPS